jgi:hypothetical protein
MLFQPRTAEGLHRSLVRFDIAERPLRDIAVELERQGYLNERGGRYSAASVQHMPQ